MSRRSSSPRPELPSYLSQRRLGPSWGTEGNSRNESSSASPNWVPACAGKVEEKEQEHHGECRSDYMCRGFESRLAERLVAQLGRAIDVRPTPGRREPYSSWRMPVGLHPVVAERSSGSNPRVSPKPVASTRTLRRMPRGTTSCHDGPRAVSRISRRRNHYTLANAGGTTSGAWRFEPSPGASRAQVSPLSSPAPNTQPWRMPRGTTC